MRISRFVFISIFLGGIFWAASPTVLPAEDAQNSGEKTAQAAAKPADGKLDLPPLPAEARVQQSMQVEGKTLHYTVTIGALPVRDREGKEVGQVVVTAYTAEGSNRPVTFAFNGGPGAASVYLNLGAIGPKRGWR
jgi:carboxypeptidase C (cathepsin A)